MSASAQNLALSTLLFLERELLGRDLDLEGCLEAGWGAVMLPHALESYHTFRYSFATH